jgi:hypothetical protein
VSTSLRTRIDRLDDRQVRLLLHYLCGRYAEDQKFIAAVRDGVDWLQGSPVNALASEGRNQDEAVRDRLGR